jgi:hypothetical protein
MAATFDEKEFLSEEAKNLEQTDTAKSQLSKAINGLQDAGAEGINRLNDKTKEMISLVGGMGGSGFCEVCVG